MERERKKRPAGFRTYMFVCLGATLTVMISQYSYIMLHTLWRDLAESYNLSVDVSRIGAQVISGIGFLGAGTIIVNSHQEVKGLTTAVGLWASGCMGIALGAGFYECAIIGALLIFISTKFLDRLGVYIAQNAPNIIRQIRWCFLLQIILRYFCASQSSPSHSVKPFRHGIMNFKSPMHITWGIDHRHSFVAKSLMA